MAQCPVKKGKRYYYLRYAKKAMRLAGRRQQENTAAFKDRYRWRAGVEATMSQYDRLTGVKHLRVRGFKAVSFAAVMKAIGLPLEKDFQTFEYLGNIGTVSLPITAAIAHERGFLGSGDLVGFLGIGSGLNCLMLGVEW